MKLAQLWFWRRRRNYERVTDKIDERTDRQRPACDEKFRSYPSKMGGI